jgi:hypothetical protein
VCVCQTGATSSVADPLQLDPSHLVLRFTVLFKALGRQKMLPKGREVGARGWPAVAAAAERALVRVVGALGFRLHLAL